MVAAQVGESRKDILHAALIVAWIEREKMPNPSVTRRSGGSGLERVDQEHWTPGGANLAESGGGPRARRAIRIDDHGRRAASFEPEAGNAVSGAGAAQHYPLTVAAFTVASRAAARRLHFLRPLRREGQSQGVAQRFGGAGIPLGFGHLLPLLEDLRIGESGGGQITSG